MLTLFSIGLVGIQREVFSPFLVYLVVCMTLLSARVDSGAMMFNTTVCTGKQIYLKCHADTIIVIQRTVYGWYNDSSETQQCKYSTDDPLKEVYSDDVTQTCNGRNWCSVTPGTRRWTGACNEAQECISTYQTIVYACIKKDHTDSICKDMEGTWDFGFINSPGFPDVTSPEYRRCGCEFRSRKDFSVRLIYVDFAKMTRMCKQEITCDTDSDEDSCRWDCYSKFRTQPTIHAVNSLKLRFKNWYQSPGGRFWLLYNGSSISVKCRNYRSDEDDVDDVEKQNLSSTTVEIRDVTVTHAHTSSTIMPVSRRRVSLITAEPTVEDLGRREMLPYPHDPEPRPEKEHQPQTKYTIIAMAVGLGGGILLTIAIFTGIICICVLRRRGSTDQKQQPVFRQNSDASHLSLDSGYSGLDPATRDTSPPSVYSELRARLRLYERILDRRDNIAFNIYDEIKNLPYDYAYSPANRNIGGGSEADRPASSNGPPAPPRPLATVTNDVDTTSHTYLSLLDNTHVYAAPSDGGYLRPLESIHGPAVYVANAERT